MIALLCKTVSYKTFHSTISTDLNQNSNIKLPQSTYPLFYNTLHSMSNNEKLLSLEPSQKPTISHTSTLEDLVFQHNFNPIQEVKSRQEQIQSCPSTKQTNPSQPNIQVHHIQSLQFQANNPIQDKLTNNHLQSINAHCISIFDGHGGNTLSQYASKKINQLIDSYLFTNLKKQLKLLQRQKTIEIIKDSISYAYTQIQQSFCQLLQQQFKTGNKDIIKIGTCAITCLIWENHLIFANSGDSQAIIITQDQNGLCYFKANQQLNTSNLDQLARIQKQFEGIDDQVLVKSKLNNKIYIKGILQPTRTLGDYYLKKQKYFNKVTKAAKTQFRGPYIKHNPQFNVIPIKSIFRHLILASDGLWDFATKKQILKVVQNHNLLSDQQSRGFSYQQLSKAYVEKPTPQPVKKLTQSLRDHVLQKCAKKKNKTLQQLIQIPPGDRRNFCDDISIITVSFREDTFS